MSYTGKKRQPPPSQLPTVALPPNTRRLGTPFTEEDLENKAAPAWEQVVCILE